MEIIVDDRERHVFPYLRECAASLNINYKIQRCEIGDYAICYKGFILMIIERKTWEDLAASMRDGRKGNVEKLLALREKTNCKIAYLIEGEACPQSNRKFGMMPIKNLRSHLDHLVMRDDIHILHSKDQEYTAKRLFELAQNYLTIKPLIKKLNELYECGLDNLETEDLDKGVKASESVDVVNTNNSVNTDEVEGGTLVNMANEVKTQNTTNTLTSTIVQSKTTYSKQQDLLKEKLVEKLGINEQLLRCIPSVGSIISTVLAEAGITVAGLYLGKHDLNSIACCKYLSGSMIGMDKAQKISKVKTIIDSISAVNRAVKIRMLSSVPLITKTTAEIILNTFGLANIIKGEVSLEVLANCKKTETMRLGEKAAANIIEAFRYVDLDAVVDSAVKVAAATPAADENDTNDTSNMTNTANTIKPKISRPKADKPKADKPKTTKSKANKQPKPSVVLDTSNADYLNWIDLMSVKVREFPYEPLY